MPDFSTPAQDHPIKLLYMGDTGSGKTGSLMSLAAAGYNLRILDTDRGVEILRDYITNPESPYVKARAGMWPADGKGLMSRVSYVTVTETFNNQNNKLIPKGTAWQGINGLLNDWKDGAKALGNIGTWGKTDILVLDSLSRIADAAMNFQLVMNGRILAGPQQSDWYQAQDLIAKMLTLLYSEAVQCNVIVVAHVAFIDNDFGSTKGYPQTLGKALSPKVGQFFNHALLARTTGQGTGQKRVILTNTSNMVELKNSAPLRVKPEYPIETGLAEYFAAIKGNYWPLLTQPASPSPIPVSAVGQPAAATLDLAQKAK